MQVKTNYIIIAASVVLAVICLFHFSPGKKEYTNNLSAHYTDSTICGKALPNATGYINDFIFLFTDAERWQLDSIIKIHEKQTTNQIAIITIDTAMLGKCTIDDYTTAIGNAWGVGQKDKTMGW